MATDISRAIDSKHKTSSDTALQDRPPKGDESSATSEQHFKLTDLAKRFLLRELAAHTPHKEIRRLLEARFNVTISLALVSHYSRSAKYKETIREERDTLDGAIQEIPISSLYYRLRERQKLFQLARDPDNKGRRNIPLANTILESAAKDIGSQRGDQDPARREGMINLKIVNQVLALPAEAIQEYIRTGKLPAPSYLVDVKSAQAQLPASTLEAETVPESDDQTGTDSKASIDLETTLSGDERS